MLSSATFLLCTYLAAAVPFGLVVTTLWGGDVDIRASGSGNIGATNVARVYGWRLAGPVIALDISKGLVPTLLAMLLWPDRGGWWAGSVAIVAFVGHCWPVYLEFRGGKGVATASGGLLALAPLPTVLAMGIWGGVLGITGRSSLAALAAAIALIPLCLWLVPSMVPVVGLLAAGIALRHLSNIRRLMRGEEAEVIKPVRWHRGATAEASAEQVLGEGPAGGTGTLPSVWREVADPFEESGPEHRIDEAADGGLEDPVGELGEGPP